MLSPNAGRVLPALLDVALGPWTSDVFLIVVADAVAIEATEIAWLWFRRVPEKRLMNAGFLLEQILPERDEKQRLQLINRRSSRQCNDRCVTGLVEKVLGSSEWGRNEWATC